MIILYSSAAIVMGFLIDMVIGDPQKFPHIVRVIGSLITQQEKELRARFPKTKKGELAAGIVLVIIVLILSTGLPYVILLITYRISPWLGFSIESLLCWQLLAVKSLRVESMKVFSALTSDDIEKARRAVSMIVGRDTDRLNRDEIARAAVETVAENTSDGVIAPMLFVMLGGAAAGCFYKAVNTMDSMLGYKTEKYVYFGRAAARFDDFANLLPARITAVLVIVSSLIMRLDYRSAYRIWKRDRKNHPSPNSAQCMSAFSGAMGLRMGGPTVYHGKIIEKPYIGDNVKPIMPEDIGKANKITLTTAIMMLVITVIVRSAGFAVL